MNISSLKENIIMKNIAEQPIIFLCKENTFIANQYINEISKILNYSIKYLDKIEQINNSNIFSIKEDNIQVFNTKELNDKNRVLKKSKYTYVICFSVDSSLKDEYQEYIVNIPKLENWQIEDYVYSICEGIQENKLKELIEMCSYDIYRIDNELKKFLPFQISERKYIFDSVINDDTINDISKYNIFNLSNAIVKRDIDTLKIIYQQLDRFDSQGVGIVTILLNNIRNIIKIQLGNNPTPESCNIPEKQFYAIKKNNCGYFTKDQLLKIFEFLTGLDYKIREGLIPTNLLLDYLLQQILI